MVRFENALHQREPDADSGHCLMFGERDAEKALEDAAAEFNWDSDALIGDFDNRQTVAAAHGDADLARIAGKLHRVGEYVEQGLLDRAGVGMHVDWLLRYVDMHCKAF